MSKYGTVFDFLLDQQRIAATALPGGLVYFYAAGSTTPQTVWTDRAKTSIAANPYTLDANGTAQIFGDGLYRIIIKDAAGVTRFDRDNINVVDFITALAEFITLNADDYASLAVAVSTIGATNTILQIGSTQSVTDNLVIPSNITLQFLPNGLINVSSGKTLTIQGQVLQIGIGQIFGGTGTVSGLQVAYPDNFVTNTTPGTTDMTLGVQKAAAASACLMFFPSSSYKVTDTSTLHNNQKVNLQGATITMAAAQKVIFDATSTSNVTVENGVFVGYGTDYVDSSSSLARAITGTSSSGLMVRGNKFSNFMYSPLCSQTALSDFSFENNLVIGPGQAALAAAGLAINPGVSTALDARNNTGVTATGTRIKIVNNTISATGQGLIIGQGSVEVLVQGNIIHDIYPEHGMYCDTGLIDLTITGNTIYHTYNHAIKVQHYDSYGVAPLNITITSNTIDTTTTDSGILINNSVPTGSPLKAYNVNITGNTIRNVAGNGVDARFVVNGVISSNAIYNPGGHGIYTSIGNNLDISSNAINLAGLNGYCDDSSNPSTGIKLYSNNIYHPAQLASGGYTYGIYFQGGANHIVSGNYVSGDSTKMTYGLQLTSPTDQSTMVVSNNVLTGATLLGANFQNLPFKYIGENVYEGNSGNDSPNGLFYALQRGLLPWMYYGNAIPVSGSWQQGTIVLNSIPTAGGSIGWACTTPGVTIKEAWTTGHGYTTGDYVSNASKCYMATNTGVAGATAPTHSSGTVSDGTVLWLYIGASTPLAVFKTFGAISA